MQQSRLLWSLRLRWFLHTQMFKQGADQWIEIKRAGFGWKIGAKFFGHIERTVAHFLTIEALMLDMRWKPYSILRWGQEMTVANTHFHHTSEGIDELPNYGDA